MIRLLPNLGGEEGPGWRSLLGEPAVAAQAWLWRMLFPADARWLYEPPDAAADLGLALDGPVFPWLDTGDRVVPWIVTADAERDRRVAGASLAGPGAEVVAAVHDKAFAHTVALEERLVPPVLRGCIAPFAPEALRAPDAADAIDAELAGWPAWARARFALKPRLGTSGRGRVAGRDGRLDRATLGSALARLAERGGALLEPWLEREADLSVALHVGAEGTTVLGSLRQLHSEAGRYLGHEGEADSRGRVFSGHEDEERLREAAALVAVAAAARGYRGPCGVDAFVFRDPEEGRPVLRPVVELNARFTAGIVVVGLVRRALPLLKERLGLRPGERLHLRFLLLDSEPGPAGPEGLRLGVPGGPSLRFARQPIP